MPLSAGTVISSYEVLALIGKGGMGEVYRARDTKLKREVALKVLPADFSNNQERMARFQREAEVLASLDHPNIGHIYGIAESDGSRALVLALIEGPTLEDRIAAGPITLEEALAIAKQVAEALEYAHEHGVIHRDLKPANIKINSDGVVKVLDFGLAKVLEDEPPAALIANSPTLTIGHTRAGMILGTAAYMSPEQAVGRPVDRRSDIFSFGAVLYEMLTGQRAFEGTTTADVLEAIVKSNVDWRKLPAQVPPMVRTLLRRCLVKDRKQRLQAIGEARILLESPAEEMSASQAASSGPAWMRWLWPGVAAVLALVAFAASYVAYSHPVAELAATGQFSILIPEKMGAGGFTSLPAISPDGRRMAMALDSGRQRVLWVRDLDGGTSHVLPGTEGATYPFWSPDSRTIGFFAAQKLMLMDEAGGPARALCDAPTGRGGTWNRDDVIVYGTVAGGLFRVSAGGGTPVALTQVDAAAGENNHRTPRFLPDGKHFLYTARSMDAAKTRIYVRSVDDPPGSHAQQEVLDADSNAVYVPPLPGSGLSGTGYLLFAREQTLMAQAFDPERIKTTGQAVPVAERVDFFRAASQANFAASENGTLVYASGGISRSLGQLTWFDRLGKSAGTVGEPGLIGWARISPDGTRVATDPGDNGLQDIWLYDLARGAASRFTFGDGASQYPVWSPDGTRIAYWKTGGSGKEGGPYSKAANGVGAEEPLNRDERLNLVTDWSGDGRYLIESLTDATNGRDIWVIPRFGDRKPFPYISTEYQEGFARLSPDGQWLAYVSNESRRNEIYLQTFPEHGGKWQISTNGGEWPVWSRDGRELYFIGADRKLMAVEVKGTAKSLQAGVPKPLFEVPVSAQFDVAKDGRFLMQAPTGQSAANPPLTVITNWQAGLKK